MTDDADIASRVVAGLRDLTPSAEFETRIIERIRARRARRRALRAGAAMAAAVAVVTTAVVVVSMSDGRDRAVVTDTSPSAFRWEELPPAPVPPRRNSSAVWTGTEVVVWGGGSGSSSRDGIRADGAAFNPTTSAWRTLPPSPIGPRGGHVAVWTGAEMIVWGGWRPLGPREAPAAWTDGAAFNPTTNTWRRIPEAPIVSRIGVGATWTGTELVVVGGTSAGGPGQAAIGAAYDPARDTWRVLPDLPVSGMTDGWAAWTGREVLYWRPVGAVVVAGEARPTPQLFAYDPEADRWREAARPDATFDLRWDGAAVEWAASELIVVSGPPIEDSQPRLQAIAYEPARDTWRRVAETKHRAAFVPHSRALWTGRELVTLDSFGYDGSALRPRTGEWATLPEGPRGLFDASIVAADDGIYVFGKERNARLVRR